MTTIEIALPEKGDEAASPPDSSPVEAVRAFGIVVGGSVLLLAGLATGVASTLRSLAGGRRPRVLGVLATGALAAYALKLRPWHMGWGATPEEVVRELPGDELREGCNRSTRAVTIDAPVEDVWPWLAQIGQDRGGFYSYSWLENLAGCRLQNADRIHPEWQHREIGDVVKLHPATGVEVDLLEPGRALGLKHWGTFVVEPLGESRTRLIVRGRGQKGVGLAAYVVFMDVPHAIMERKMLLGIRDRAERLAREREAAEPRRIVTP